MADYYPLISRAVAGMEKNTGENRRALYERARKALVDQLRGVQPPLSETDITRERLALEEAIRKVETDSARQLRQAAPPVERRPKAEEPPPPAAEPKEPEETEASQAPAVEPDDAPPAEPAPVELPAETAPEDMLPDMGHRPQAPADAPLPEPPPIPTPSELLRRSERNWLERKPSAGEGLKGFGNVVADAESLGDAAAQASRSAREQFSAVPSPSPEFERLEPRLDSPTPEPRLRAPERPRERPVDMRSPRAPERSRHAEAARPPEPRRGPPRADLGPVIGDDEEDLRPRAPGAPRSLEPPVMPESFRYVSERARQAQQEAEPGFLRRFMSGAGIFIIVVLVLVLVGATAYWQRHNLAAGVSKVVNLIRSPATAPTTQPRDNGQQRTKINDRIGQPDAAQQEAPVAQRVMLYEQDPKDANGKQFTGNVVWKSEQQRGERGQPADRTLRADINIPARNTSITLIFARNFDRTVQFSHTILIQFNFPPGFDHGEVAEIRGVLMKPAEQVRGESLSGSAVRVKENLFLVGLNSAEPEYQRNVKVLKEMPWFDIAIEYKDKLRAILAVEKGTPGERAFAETFAAWGQ